MGQKNTHEPKKRPANKTRAYSYGLEGPQCVVVQNTGRTSPETIGEVRMSARDLIRTFFEENVGKKVTTKQIRRVAKISEYARRIRELRDEEGMQIRSHIDRSDLKPGEYLLESLKKNPAIERGISPQLRKEILERNGFTCQLCGAGTGDPDTFNPGRTVRLHIDHIKPASQGGADNKENLRALCSMCNHSKANIQPPTESVLNVVARIRRMSREERKEIFQILKKSIQTGPSSN